MEFGINFTYKQSSNVLQLYNTLSFTKYFHNPRQDKKSLFNSLFGRNNAIRNQFC